MSTDGRPNTGPLDFFYLLKRRGISFDRWCRSSGIKTKADFSWKRTQVESQGEYFFPPEMVALSAALPDPQEATPNQEQVSVEPPTLSSSPNPIEPQEEPPTPKKTKKSVMT